MKCSICDAEASSPLGQTLPLCLEHEVAWQKSSERAFAATARRRFIDRLQAGQPDRAEDPSPITIRELQHLTGTWADRVFPNRTIHTTLSKLVLEEIPEFLLSDANDPDEYADLLILVLDAAHQKRIDAGGAALAKHHRNTERVWKQTESGVYHHEKGLSMGLGTEE